MSKDSVKVDPKELQKKHTQTDLDEAFALLAKKKERQAKIEAGLIKGSYKGKLYSELSDEQKEKARKYAARREIRRSLLIEKAKAQGITVSEKEVDDEIAKKFPTKVDKKAAAK